MNRKMTELLQNMPKADSAAFLEDARREAKTIQIPRPPGAKPTDSSLRRSTRLSWPEKAD